MKKFKAMLSMLILAVMLVGVVKATPVLAATTGDPVNATVIADEAITVDYENMWIKVTGVEAYYQVVKTPVTGTETATVKPAAWIKATVKGTDSYIDISAITKDTYFAITTNSAEKLITTVNTIAAGNLTSVLCTVKSIKPTIDFRIDEPDDLYEAFAKIEVVGTAAEKAGDVVYNVFGGDGTVNLAGLLAKYKFAWKRGANGTWTDAADATDSDAFKQEYAMLRTSNSTLYLRAYADANGNMLPSKEVKIKIAKTANAPTIKVDYGKGTIALKNGMEFKTDKTGDTIFCVLTKDSKSEAETIFGLNKDYTTVTGKAVSVVSIADLKAQIDAVLTAAEGGEATAPGDAVVLNVRTSATAKKYASAETNVSVVLPIDAPALKTEGAVKFVYNSTENFISLDFADVEFKTGRTLEFTIAKDTDVDLAKAKWTKVPVTESEDAYGTVKIAKADAAIKYVKTNGSKDETTKFSEGIVIYRYAANTKASEGIELAFASATATTGAATSVQTLVTYDFTLTSATVAMKNGTADVTAETESEGKKFKVEKHSTEKVTITVTPAAAAEGKVIDKVTYKIGTATPKTINKTNDAYTFELPKKESAEVTVEVTYKDAPTT